MEIKSLMVGDWVNTNGTNVKIISIGLFTQVEIMDSSNDVYSVFARDLVPIPLTPEILEKNGFVLIEKEKGAYGVNIAPYYTRDDVPFEVFCDGEPFAIWFKDPVNIEFVHQLQHALRLCGIDKEIEL